MVKKEKKTRAMSASIEVYYPKAEKALVEGHTLLALSFCREERCIVKMLYDKFKAEGNRKVLKRLAYIQCNL